MTLLDIPTRTRTVEHALNEARSRIQVTPEELAEARRRRDALAAALKREFGGRTYVNGSIAHGDALNPLTDVDLGIVIPDPDGLYGPGLLGPGALQERAADAIRRELKDEYPKLRVEHLNRRRSILVRFGDPVTPARLTSPRMSSPRSTTARKPGSTSRTTAPGIAATPSATRRW